MVSPLQTVATMQSFVVIGTTAVCRMALVGLIVTAVTACVVGEDVLPDPAEDVDATMLTELLPYRTWPTVGNPYPSALGSYLVSLYISDGKTEYAKIRPTATGSHAQLPVGTVIVREVFAEDGTLAKLTVMGKGPAGYDPTLGDWWFAVTDVHGKPLMDNGHPQTGKIAGCKACHATRSADDFLYGAK